MKHILSLRAGLKIRWRSAPVLGRSSVLTPRALEIPTPTGFRTLLRPRTGALHG